LALLLAGCFRNAPPMKVSFPDDPRVLDGQWNVRVTGTHASVRSFVHAPNAGRLVTWTWDDLQSYQRLEGGEWALVESPLVSSVRRESYDASLEAFVTASLKAAPPTIRVTKVDGSPVTTVQVEVPTGREILEVLVGSGRVFALASTGAGHEVLWWDATTGASGQPVPVRNPRDGARISANGRILAVWNLDTYGASLIDTAAERPSARDLQLGACRSNGTTIASDDGRWFVFSDCQSNLRVADLGNPTPESSPLGVRHQAQMRFAAGTGSDELVWVDHSGVVMRLNVVTRERSELARLGASERSGLDPWHTDLLYDPAQDLLALISGRGTVRLSDASGLVEVPALPMALARMELEAGAVNASLDGYPFTGTFTVIDGVGAGAPLDVSGFVYAHGLHEYVPPTGLGPAAWLPSLSGRAQVLDPVNQEELYGLTFGTRDKRAETYAGSLSVVGTTGSFRVLVERPATAP
jgi:hypothetical protein